MHHGGVGVARHGAGTRHGDGGSNPEKALAPLGDDKRLGQVLSCVHAPLDLR